MTMINAGQMDDAAATSMRGGAPGGARDERSVLASRINRPRFDQRICYIFVHQLKISEKGVLHYRLYAHHDENGSADMRLWTNFIHPNANANPAGYPNNKPVKPQIEALVANAMAGGTSPSPVKGASLTQMEFRHRAYHAFFFDHDGWEFASGAGGQKPPVLFDETGHGKNHSFFDGFFMDVAANGTRRNVFVMVNHRKKDGNGEDLPTRGASPGPAMPVKFDLLTYLPLDGGGRLLVQFDPTGNNTGSTFAPPPP